MHPVKPYQATHRLVGRDGRCFAFPTLTALCHALADAGYLCRGTLSDSVVSAFSTIPATDGSPALSLGEWVVEGPDGLRIERERIARAAPKRARSRKSRRPRCQRPRKRHVNTMADRRLAMEARADLREDLPHMARLAGPLPRLDDPWEDAPSRRPERSWKRHRAHAWH